MEIKDQGAYYLILSLVALQSFVDLGVISVMASVILRDWTEFKNTTSYQTRENKISIIRGYAHFFFTMVFGSQSFTVIVFNNLFI